MKRIITLSIAAVCVIGAYAQRPNDGEIKRLQSFIQLPSQHPGKTNAEALHISDINNPAAWEGIVISNGHVTRIDWKGKHLAGQLDLSGFAALSNIDVSHNALTSLSVAGCTALAELNASHNRLVQIGRAHV